MDWVEHSGPENGGHWIREPEGIDAIVSFLEASFSQMKRGEERASGC